MEKVEVGFLSAAALADLPKEKLGKVVSSCIDVNGIHSDFSGEILILRNKFFGLLDSVKDFNSSDRFYENRLKSDDFTCLVFEYKEIFREFFVPKTFSSELDAFSYSKNFTEIISDFLNSYRDILSGKPKKEFKKIEPSSAIEFLTQAGKELNSAIKNQNLQTIQEIYFSLSDKKDRLEVLLKEGDGTLEETNERKELLSVVITLLSKCEGGFVEEVSLDSALDSAINSVLTTAANEKALDDMFNL